jgi:hypothetical protein
MTSSTYAGTYVGYLHLHEGSSEPYVPISLRTVKIQGGPRPPPAPLSARAACGTIVRALCAVRALYIHTISGRGIEGFGKGVHEGASEVTGFGCPTDGDEHVCLLIPREFFLIDKRAAFDLPYSQARHVVGIPPFSREEERGGGGYPG